MYCINSSYIFEETIKKSRFIALIMPCGDEAGAMQQLKQCYRNYPDASHITFAYRIKTSKGIIYRFHDAGEPSGTAGKPIFQHLEGKQLINLLLVVVRYFGGIKLGAGGLVRAYGNCARQVIETADICPYIELDSIELVLDYNQLQSLEYQLKKLEGAIVQQDFTAQVKVLVQLPAVHTPALLQLFPGAYRIEPCE